MAEPLDATSDADLIAGAETVAEGILSADLLGELSLGPSRG